MKEAEKRELLRKWWKEGECSMDLRLQCGPLSFAGIKASLKLRAIALRWVGETSLRDVLWAHIIILRLGWPPFGMAEGWFERRR